MPACSRCLVEVPVGTALCPKCGAAIRPPVLQPTTPKRVTKRRRRRLESLGQRDAIVGGATLVLLVSLWLPWFSIGPASIDGVSAHGFLFLAMVNAIVVVLYAVIVAFDVGDLGDFGRLSKEQVLALLTGVNLVLVILGVLLKPTGLSWSWGALLALVAAIVAFLPFGIPLVQSRRRR